MREVPARRECSVKNRLQREFNDFNFPTQLRHNYFEKLRRKVRNWLVGNGNQQAKCLILRGGHNRSGCGGWI
jgi:hypothetical protein